MVGGEHSLKISAFELLLFGIESVWKILNKRITNSVDELISYKIVYRTAPATPGLLILLKPNNTIEYFLLKILVFLLVRIQVSLFKNLKFFD